MAGQRRISFTSCLLGLAVGGLALAGTAPGLPRGDEPSREQQIKDLDKQLQDLSKRLSELKKENPKAPAAATPDTQTKVAVLNLSHVMKKYHKFEIYQKEYKAKVDDYDKVLKPFKQQLDELAKEVERPGIGLAAREQLESQYKEVSRAMQERVEEYKKALADFDSASFTKIYNDIKGAAARYAKVHGIELIMHYNDGATEDEANEPNAIGRKMSQAALFPVYMAPGMDVSTEVLALLNEIK